MTNVTRVTGDVNQLSAPQDFRKTRPFRDRIYLEWQAGSDGKPSLNADFVSSTEAENVLADRHFEALGTNMTSALSTYGVEGGITMTTAGADGDGAFLVPHLDTNLTPWTVWTWGTDREVEYACRFQTGASVANVIYWCGLKLTNTNVVATDADQVFFRAEDDAGETTGNWDANYSIANTDTTTDTGLALTADTDYLVHIKINEDRIATMTITDGTTKSTTISTALTDAIDLIPYLCVEADGAAAAKAFTVFGQAISRLEGA